jgi:hypothetical protein
LAAAGVTPPGAAAPAAIHGAPEAGSDEQAVNDAKFAMVKGAVEQDPNVRAEELVQTTMGCDAVSTSRKTHRCGESNDRPGAQQKASPAAAPTSQPQDFQPVGTQADKEAQGVAPEVLTGDDTHLQQAAAQGDPQAQEQIHQHHDNLMAALNAIGMGTTLRRSWGRHHGHDLEAPVLHNPCQNLTIDGKPASEYEVPVFKGGQPALDPTGKPITRKIGNSKTDLLRELVRRIYVDVLGQDADNPVLKRGKFPTSALGYISNRLGGLDSLSGGRGKLNIISELLLKLGAMKTGSTTRPPTPGPKPGTPGGSSGGAAAQPPATAPAANTAATANPASAATATAEPDAAPQATGSPVVDKLKQSGAWDKVVNYLRSADPSSYGDEASVVAALKDAAEAEGLETDADFTTFANNLAAKAGGGEQSPAAAQAIPAEAPAAPPVVSGSAAGTSAPVKRAGSEQVDRLANMMVNILGKDPVIQRLGNREALYHLVTDMIGKEKFDPTSKEQLQQTMEKVKAQLKQIAQGLPTDMVDAEPESEDQLAAKGGPTGEPAAEHKEDYGKEYHDFMGALKAAGEEHGAKSTHVTRLLEDMYEKLQSQLLGSSEAALDKAAERAAQYEDDQDFYKYLEDIKGLFSELLRKSKAKEFSGNVTSPVAAPATSPRPAGGLSSFMNKIRPKTTEESVRSMIENFKKRILESKKPASGWPVVA